MDHKFFFFSTVAGVVCRTFFFPFYCHRYRDRDYTAVVSSRIVIYNASTWTYKTGRKASEKNEMSIHHSCCEFNTKLDYGAVFNALPAPFSPEFFKYETSIMLFLRPLFWKWQSYMPVRSIGEADRKWLSVIRTKRWRRWNQHDQLLHSRGQICLGQKRGAIKNNHHQQKECVRWLTARWSTLVDNSFQFLSSCIQFSFSFSSTLLGEWIGPNGQTWYNYCILFFDTRLN